ncbi:MFS transporter [Rathayibacter tanaceti]|uniref:MFS transporter n=2 Tax=Rathayibacter tanaceti TaxID=1671680 RepID=A0A162FZ98_9MICO|nr:MFS transporter [Rathayibacter tanaceti]KZX21770.1 hypothetical protein ACH61_01074 [Rathayibacter tanaceti]QHC54488.1 MFS transporter [Rathayibacter tanaceti]TCO35021.1 hypothetical protein EV639_10925 [Rathayibacter tanaceti]
MTARFVRALALLVLVRAGGFSSIVAVVWLRDAYSASETAMVLTAFGVGAMILPGLAGFLVTSRTLRPILTLAMAVNGVVMLLVPLTFGGPVAVIAGLMFVVGATSSLARSLLGTLITFASADGLQTRTQSMIAWAANLGAAVATGIAGLVSASNQQYGVLFTVEGVVLIATAPVVLTLGRPTVPPLAGRRILGIGGVQDLAFALGIGLAATAIMQGLGMTFALVTRHPDSFVLAALLNGVLILVLQPFVVRVVRDARSTSYLVWGFAAATATSITVAATDSWVVLGLGWTIAELLLTAGMAPTVLARTPPRLHAAAIGIIGSSWGITAAALPVLIVSSSTLAGPSAGWSLLAVIGVAFSLALSFRPRNTTALREREP